MYYNAIKYLYPDILDNEFELRDDGKGAYISMWAYKVPQPTVKQLEAVLQQAEIPTVIRKINQIAQDKIYKIAPAYKQANMLARSIELVSIADKSPAEQAEEAAIRSIWDIIKEIRAYSNVLSADVSAGKDVDITAGWPV